MNTTVASRGQITLPRFVREALGLKAGSKVSHSRWRQGNSACDPRRPAPPGAWRDPFGGTPREAR